MSRSCFEKLGNETLLNEYDEKIKLGVSDKNAAYEVVVEAYNGFLERSIHFKSSLELDSSLDKAMLDKSKIDYQSKSESVDYEETVDEYIYKVYKYNHDKKPNKNTKEARDNAKIDIILSVLRHEATLPSIINPGSYAKLKDQASRMVTDKLQNAKKPQDLFSVMSRIRIATQNMAGKQMVGISASHNSHHALRQHANLAIPEITFNGVSGATSISITKPLEQWKYNPKTKNLQKEEVSITITKNIAEFLAAIVDNANDPLAESINYNEVTADLYMLILSAGYDTLTATSFMTQPVIIELARIAKTGVSMDVAIKMMNNNYYKINTKKVSVSDLSIHDLHAAIGSGDLITKLQQEVFESFIAYNKIAKDFSKLISASRGDKGLGSSLADGEVSQSNIAEIAQREDDDKFLIKGSKEFLLGAGKSNFVNMFTEYGINKPMNEILQKLFPYNNDMFFDAKEKIRESKYGGYPLSAANRNLINDNLINFLMSRFFDPSERGYYVNQFPRDFFDYIKANKDIKTNKLIRAVLYDAKNKSISYDRLSFTNTGSLTQEQKADIKAAWEQLLNNSEHSKLANDLIKYSYFTSGLGFGAKGFSHLVPLTAYTDLIKNDAGETLAQSMYNIVNGSKKADFLQEFFDQFMRNQWHNKAFVPRNDENNTLTPLKNETENPDTYAVDGKDSPSFSLSHDERSNLYEYVPFINYKTDKKDILLKYSFTNDQGEGIYEEIEKLGIKYYMSEYLIGGGSLMESIVDYNLFTDEEATEEDNGYGSIRSVSHMEIDSSYGNLDNEFDASSLDESIQYNPNEDEVSEAMLASLVKTEPKPKFQKKVDNAREDAGLPSEPFAKPLPIEPKKSMSQVEYTPENITTLKSNEVFVFGSNEGDSRGGKPTHGRGGALLARQKFGAKQGQSRGLQGQSYAVVTKKYWDKEKSSTLNEIGKEIQTMLLFAKANPNKKFLVTKLGSSLAGYSEAEIKGLFEILKKFIPENVILPKEYEVRYEAKKAITSNVNFNFDIDLSGVDFSGASVIEAENKAKSVVNKNSGKDAAKKKRNCN